MHMLEQQYSLRNLCAEFDYYIICFVAAKEEKEKKSFTHVKNDVHIPFMSSK